MANEPFVDDLHGNKTPFFTAILDYQMVFHTITEGLFSLPRLKSRGHYSAQLRQKVASCPIFVGEWNRARRMSQVWPKKLDRQVSWKNSRHVQYMDMPKMLPK